MTSSTFNLIMPAFNLPARSDAEAFGSAVWLWMHGKNQRDVPLAALDSLLLTPISLGQYALLMEEGSNGTRPVAYIAWANFSAEAEGRYLIGHSMSLRKEDWTSGDRMWFTDFFAPFGHARTLRTLVQQQLTGASVRYMYHRSNERGVRVLTFTGAAVDPAYASQWWADRPMLATPATDAAR